MTHYIILACFVDDNIEETHMPSYGCTKWLSHRMAKQLTNPILIDEDASFEMIGVYHLQKSFVKMKRLKQKGKDN